jgi:FkbM family methyltransferase
MQKLSINFLGKNSLEGFKGLFRGAIRKFPSILLIASPLLSVYFKIILIPTKKGYILLSKGLKFYCPFEENFNSVAAFKEIFQEGRYDQMDLSIDDIVIDCGAHVGFYSIKAASQCHKVLAIEPSPHNASLFRKNTKKFNNVVIIEKALDERERRTRLFLSASDAHSMLTPTNSSIEVETTTIDQVLQDIRLQAPGNICIKMNVEGMELATLRGAKDTLKNANVKLAIAAHHSSEELDEVSKYLLDLGFEISSKKQIIFATKRSINS